MTQSTLEPLLDADLAAVEALARAVGWPHRAPDIGPLFPLGTGYVVRDAQGMAEAVGLWWPCDAETATVGLIIVSPERQGRGLGRLIVERLLSDTDGRALKLTATDAGRPLYERLGFRAIGGIRQMQGECTVEAASDPRIRPAVPEDHDAIVALDAAAFGATRDAAMRSVLAAGFATVLVEDGELSGFAVRRPFGRGEVIGPIVARDEADAGALFRATTRRGFIRVDRPADANRFAVTLGEAGLVEVDPPVLMVRGDWPAPRGVRTFSLVNQALC